MEFFRMMILIFFIAIISSCILAIISIFFDKVFGIMKEKLKEKKEKSSQKNEWKNFGRKIYKKNHFE